ncbi:MAG: hypothetical protein MUQ30_09500 [Anaerolineae bacterium]|nr:hypothetical protein [Anaerolineae bacterium]
MTEQAKKNAARVKEIGEQQERDIARGRAYAEAIKAGQTHEAAAKVALTADSVINLLGDVQAFDDEAKAKDLADYVAGDKEFVWVSGADGRERTEETLLRADEARLDKLERLLRKSGAGHIDLWEDADEWISVDSGEGGRSLRAAIDAIKEVAR